MQRDGVALFVRLAVEGWWPAIPAAPSLPVASLVRRDRDHRAALAQVVADRAGRIGLVRQDHVRSVARTTTSSGNAQAGHDVGNGTPARVATMH
jgi:hypothetical protein